MSEGSKGSSDAVVGEGDIVYPDVHQDPRRIPQVLTKAAVPTLVAGLDAGDVLECYLITRTSYLHGIAENRIPVHKQVIGLRYRPPSSASNTAPAAGANRGSAFANGITGKPPLSLTLEYGPTRTGRTPDLPHDVLPRIVPEDNEVDMVTWENEAQVYYTTSISPDTHEDANYVTSLTGAVLSHLLLEACAYPLIPSRRRYQPFAVVDVRTNATLLRSSSDRDFIQAMMQVLANVGVVLQPIIPPHPGLVQLTAIGKVERIPTATSRTVVAQFYQTLYKCVEAIAAANVTAALPIPSAPTAAPSKTPSMAPSMLDVALPVEPEVATDPPIVPGDDVPDNGNNDSGNNFDNLPSLLSKPPRRLDQQSILINLSGPPPSEPLASMAPVPSIPASIGAVGESPAPTSVLQPPIILPSVSLTKIPSMTPSSPLSTAPSSATLSTLPPSFPPTTVRPPVSESDLAAQAAQQAQQAANDAASSGNSQAAKAASQAASAAQKAADLTAVQAAFISRDALFSGDGASVTAALSKCLSEPRFGLVNERIEQVTNDVDGESIVTNLTTTTAYLYWDGHFYYRVNLTAPFLQVVPRLLDLPPPASASSGAALGADDFVDWSLALVIFACFLVGCLLIFQAVMGRNLRIIRPLYKCQRWFFDPLQHNYADLDETSEADGVFRQQHGWGREYSFGEDVIPLSMGGRRATGSTPPHTNYSEHDEDDLFWSGKAKKKSNGGHISGEKSEMELTNLSEGRKRLSTNGSFREDEESPLTSHRLFRDPDLVEMPTLHSTSKVAVPVSLSPDKVSSTKK
jgi:hypothetical protein